MKHKMIFIFSIICFLSCKKNQIEIKHRVPSDYEGPVYWFHHKNAYKGFLSKKNIIVIDYDKEGIFHSNDSLFNIEVDQKNVTHEFFYWDGSSETKILNHKLYAGENNKLGVIFRVDIVRHDTAEIIFYPYRAKIDSVLKANKCSYESIYQNIKSF